MNRSRAVPSERVRMTSLPRFRCCAGGPSLWFPSGQHLHDSPARRRTMPPVLGSLRGKLLLRLPGAVWHYQSRSCCRIRRISHCPIRSAVSILMLCCSCTVSGTFLILFHDMIQEHPFHVFEVLDNIGALFGQGGVKWFSLPLGSGSLSSTLFLWLLYKPHCPC